MQAAVYRGKEKIQVQDWPEPELSGGEVLVRVRYAGICGTDLMIYNGKHPRVVPPRVLGHEVFGCVEEVGADVESSWKAGTRVAIFPLISCMQCAPCREGHTHVCEKLALIGIDRDGGFAKHVKARPDQLVAIPDSMDDEQAALVEPLSVAVHAVRNSRFRPGDTALITGGGPIGNLLAQVLRASGARKVIVSEIREFRRGLASSMGFGAINPVEEDSQAALRRLIGQRFVDCVFEASGSPAAYRDAVQCCKVRGEITFVGLPKSPPELDIAVLVYKEIQASSARVYALRDFHAAISLLERGAVDVTPVITDRLALKDVALGFQKMLGAETSLKILLAPEAPQTFAWHHRDYR